MVIFSDLSYCDIEMYPMCHKIWNFTGTVTSSKKCVAAQTTSSPRYVMPATTYNSGVAVEATRCDVANNMGRDNIDNPWNLVGFLLINMNSNLSLNF